MATINEVFPSDSLLWLEFGGIYTDSAGNRVIDNLATRGDAPARVTCGAGAACPTQLSGRRGVSFAGAQWIDCGLVDRFERTDAFTLVMSATSTINGASRMMLASQDDAQDYRGIILYHQTANELILTLSTNGNTGKYIQKNYGPANMMRSTNTVAATYNGSSLASGCIAYYNGGLASLTSTISDTLNGSVKNGKPFLIGARHNGAAKIGFFVGTIHFAAIFPLAASPLQIANLHKRVMRRISLP